jgi:hypothetical protein
MSKNYYSQEDVEYDLINFMDKEFMGIRIKLWLLLIVVVVAMNYIKNNQGPNGSSSGVSNPLTGKIDGSYGYY